MSNGQGIVVLKGMPFVLLKSETFTSNGDVFNEKLIDYASQI